MFIIIYYYIRFLYTLIVHQVYHPSFLEKSLRILVPVQIFFDILHQITITGELQMSAGHLLFYCIASVKIFTLLFVHYRSFVWKMK